MDFGSILTNLKDKLTLSNQDTPSIVGNLVAGNKWNWGLPRFGGVAPQNQFIENPDIISPIQRTSELTSGLINKMKQEQSVGQTLSSDTSMTPEAPRTVEYPDWLSNAPSQQEQSFLKRLRAERPNYGGTDIEALQLYRKYGDKLLGANPTPTPEPAVLGSSDNSNPDTSLWDQFVSAVQNTAPKLGYNSNAIIRQKALESNFGRSNFAQNRLNFGGIGAYDSNPNQALTFKDITDYLNYYYKLVQSRYPQAYANREDPQAYIEGLKSGGYASDPQYVWKVLNTPLKP